MQTNINKPDSDKDVLLKMVDIEKSFPGVKALDHAQLTVRRGTVHALMGENGAGKSTLINASSAFTARTADIYMSTVKR